MRHGIIVSMLAGMAVIVLSAAIVRAGGGAGATAFNTFFECQSIDGTSVGEVVSTHEFDASDTAIHTNVRVGAGVLKCRQVNVKNSAGLFINGDTSSTEIKCYSVSTKGPKAASAAVSLQDDFFSSETVNQSQGLQMLCGPTIPTAVP